MALDLDQNKPGIDLGIVVRDSAAALAFYRDVLGLEHVADMAMPVGAGGTMHRLACGNTVLKLVSWNDNPAGSNPPGGLHTATGIRYLTIWINNLDEATAACSAAGCNIVMQPVEIRKGVRISMVEDPDGNWVELLQNG